MSKKTKRMFIALLVIGGLVFTALGATFSYLSIGRVTNTEVINGATYNFKVALDVSAVRSGNLIPVADNLIISTLNSTHVCEDARGYGLCSLYKIKFTNSGSAQTMIGILVTINSTYTTDHLKYQLFTLSGSTYTAASDMKVVSRTANAENTLTVNNANVTISLADGSTSSVINDSYYLAIWLSDNGNNQLEDQNKAFTGKLTFTSSLGDRISSQFINS